MSEQQQRKHPPVWGHHAVTRLFQRGGSTENMKQMMDAIRMIVEYGVTVEKNGPRSVKRGELEGEPVHVIVEKPNVIITLYFADEWESHIVVKRQSKPQVQRTAAVS
ncbi:DUF4258 domain-containing protein [Alicyclobacillus fodiniaquatilis]|uniref:DUF4258 domain-containing protein n=1 Tax=Alicyclobacillus fodiniaquatilis TaxID=1661150 RepID=A0ABW4JII3_9BACL